MKKLILSLNNLQLVAYLWRDFFNTPRYLVLNEGIKENPHFSFILVLKKSRKMHNYGLISSVNLKRVLISRQNWNPP